MLSELLGSLGYRSLCVASAREALACSGTKSWDIALIDIDLPEIDGYETARILRATSWGRLKRLVALTGFSDGAARDAAEQAGFDDFLVKPVFPERLAQLLERAS